MGPHRLAALGALSLIVLSSAPAAAAPALAPSGTLQARPANGIQAARGAAGPARIHRPVVPSKEKLDAGKAAAALGRAPGVGGSASPAPSAAVGGPGLNQPGLAATNNSAANQGTPPDTTGAIGPQHYLEFVNSKVGVYGRSNLGLLGSRDLDAFVGRAGQDVFDPQIQWDQQGGRWLYVADDIDSIGRNFLAFGWSKTADPSDLTNGWCRFVVSTDMGSRFLEDYPKLGHDNLHILFGTNSTHGNSFFTAHVYSLPKPANGDASCATPTLSTFGSPTTPLQTSDGDFAFTPVPANTADSAAAGYVIAADSPFFVASPAQIMAWHVGGTATSPALIADGNMNVSSFAFPANVPQPGSTQVIDSSDTRITQAVAHAEPAAGGEAVWAQHTVDGPGGRAVVRWYELLPATLAVRQLGTISNSSRFVFNAAISPANDGSTAAVNYNTGSSSAFVDIRAQSRIATTALGTMGGEVTLGTSSAIDQDFSCGGATSPCRWGDYAGASPDPLFAQLVWGSSQLNGPTTTDPAWITRNFAIVDNSSTGYPRPKGASPLRVSLVPAYAGCSAPNRSHGAPLAFGSCAPPAQASPLLTVGTTDSNGANANAIASVRLDAVAGDPLTVPDEADVKVKVSSTDVRLAAGLGDYTGELEARLSLRITDRGSGPTGDEAATVQDFDLPFTVPCTATGDPATGASCSLDTSADAVTPGTVTETRRTIWELDAVQLLDGGPDGVASTTSGNSLFETQGVFVP
jgi:hypothetical protein